MVNGRFPSRRSPGPNAETPATAARLACGQSAGRIFEHRTRAAFAQILRKLQFLEFSESSRQILIDYETSCICAANPAFNAGSYTMRTPEGKKKCEGQTSRAGKGRVMFFLLRVAFWLCVVLILLPTGKSQEASKASQVGAVEAVSAASAAISDLGQFCERQPGACAVGGQAAVSLGHKARDGAKMLYEFLTEKLAPSETGSISRTPANPGSASPARSPQHTLTPADLEPAWRLPQPRASAEPRRPA
jgi:hypothetical protein